MERTTRPTHADVARLASVSTATVSYVLNKSEGRRISPRTREAVYRAAEKLGYRPNAAARNLARGKSGVVLYVVPRVAVGEMPMQAGSRMTTELARRGLLQVQIFETEDDQHVIDAVENLDPVAVTSLFPLSSGARSAVDTANIPHIEIGTLPALGDPHLSVGAIRVEHLVSRGHRRSRSRTPASPNGVLWVTIGLRASPAQHGPMTFRPSVWTTSRWTTPPTSSRAG